MTKDEALKQALEALKKDRAWLETDAPTEVWEKNNEAITAIKAALEAKDEKQKPVNIKKVAEEHGINLPTEFVPKHDESKAAIQSLTDQCAALIWERDELQKQMWRSEKQEPVATICTWHKNGIQHAEYCDWDKGIEGLPDGEHSLYTTPPPVAEPHKRTWVGLTDEEIQTEWLLTPQHDKAEGIWFGRRLEAKLRSKNDPH